MHPALSKEFAACSGVDGIAVGDKSLDDDT